MFRVSFKEMPNDYETLFADKLDVDGICVLFTGRLESKGKASNNDPKYHPLSAETAKGLTDNLTKLAAEVDSRWGPVTYTTPRVLLESE